MSAYATVDDYRLATDDATSSDERIEALLVSQSAKLRARCSISASRTLTSDQAELAKTLVVDAASKALKQVLVEGLGDVTGAKQASFTANSFQASYTFSNPQGVAYFDRDTLKAFLRSLGKSQQAGMIVPSYGG